MASNTEPPVMGLLGLADHFAEQQEVRQVDVDVAVDQKEAPNLLDQKEKDAPAVEGGEVEP